jgi:hypothetical protein
MNQLLSVILQSLQNNVYLSFFVILLVSLLIIFILQLIAASHKEGRSVGFFGINLGAKPPSEQLTTTSPPPVSLDKIDKKEVSPRLPPISVPVLKRVCMISSEYPPRIYGGLGVHVDNLSKAISSHVDVDIILPCNKNTDDGCSYYPRTARIHPEPMAKTEASYEKPISWLFFAQHVSDKIKNLNTLPDIVHCHDWVTILGGIKCR